MIAAAAAAAHTPENPVGLILLGDGYDRARVERAAARHPHVRLMQPTRDRQAVAALFASVDALIHGSESETFGLVVAEAAASGLPVIAPDRGACAELAAAEARETYRSADVRSATAAIRRLLARDPAELRAAAAAGASRVRSDSAHYTELFTHYEQLLRRSAAANVIELQPRRHTPQPAGAGGRRAARAGASV